MKRYKLESMQLTKYFNLLEFFPNPNYRPKTIGSDVFTNILFLASRIHHVRCHFGKPLIITSGYRTIQQNRDYGGSATSMHLKGLAVDVTCAPADFGRLKDVAQLFQHEFDQIIIYPNKGFVHFGLPRVGEEPRNQLFYNNKN